MRKQHNYVQMAINSRILLLSIVVLLPICSVSQKTNNSSLRIKAVNLGGWLVTEGWIKPSLFDGIPNNDFLDGTGLQFKSVTTGKYLCAETGGGTIIVANRTAASGWETFSLWRLNETTFQFRVSNKQFVGLNNTLHVANYAANLEKVCFLSLFDGIPNNDFLDGTGLQFKSVTTGKYLCAEIGGGTIIVANRTAALGWETFSLWRLNETTFQFRVSNKQFVGLNNNGNGIDVVAVSTTPGKSETFEIVRKSDDKSRVRIRAPNGFFLQAKSEVLVTADFAGNSEWGDNDPSVFVMKNSSVLRGEFQVTNGYGSQRAPQIMQVRLKKLKHTIELTQLLIPSCLYSLHTV
ncbi:uncharacterized protein LOC112038098 [Quercus suber]|uniref:uncharacterized protein LOC112038098 n=1 Tax=Quercus suber TaxID=58331 RepID=UPI0032DE5304